MEINLFLLGNSPHNENKTPLSVSVEMTCWKRMCRNLKSTPVSAPISFLVVILFPLTDVDMLHVCVGTALLNSAV